MKSRSTARILGKRIWMSLVLEGQDSLTVQDIIDVVGEHSRDECEAVFAVLDQDGNGDLTLDEMSAAVTQICHERKSIYKSLKDVDCAVKKLHHILVFVVLLICIIIFVGMLSPSVGAVLATLGTTLLAFSFVFSTTCQEILSSCVFLFVKHPIDVGDRVDIADVAYNVTSLSLLYSTFTRTDNGKLCQAPNSLLNTLWIGNVSRSGLQSDPQTLILGLPETSTEDIDELHRRVDQFALDNPKDYKPKPWFQVSGFTDLDRISITINITHRSNFADIPLWGYRRTKFLKFVAQCVQEIPLYVPVERTTTRIRPTRCTSALCLLVSPVYCRAETTRTSLPVAILSPSSPPMDGKTDPCPRTPPDLLDLLDPLETVRFTASLLPGEPEFDLVSVSSTSLRMTTIMLWKVILRRITSILLRRKITLMPPAEFRLRLRFRTDSKTS